MSAGSRGFVLLGLLIVVALMGAGLAAYGELASHAMQREKEAELLFRGHQYRDAIARFYQAKHRLPQDLAELLDEPNSPTPAHYLRRLYRDPMTGREEWGLAKDDQGGIEGVYSESEEKPIKTAGFAPGDDGFAEAKTYQDWKFAYTPPGG